MSESTDKPTAGKAAPEGMKSSGRRRTGRPFGPTERQALSDGWWSGWRPSVSWNGG